MTLRGIALGRGITISILLVGAIFASLNALNTVWGADKGGRNQGVVNAVRHTTTFGTLGIVDGQTARLSVVRAGDDDGGLCKVDLNFFDTQGNRHGGGLSADLEPSHAIFLDLSRADIDQETNESRAQVYAVVDVTSEAKKNKPSCHAAMSIEIYDDVDGRTRIYQGAFTAADKVGQLCCCICCKVNEQDKCTEEVCNCSRTGGTPTCPSSRECSRPL